MSRFILIFFGIVYCSPQAYGLTELIQEIIQKYDTNIVRVRTVAEMANRSSENAVLDFIGLVEQYSGYTAEHYTVQTSDGYILTLHRVSGSPSSPAASGKPVVYIGHGLFGSSDFFAILGPQQALLFMLADAGYDVWIGNFRGNTYSRKHTTYSTIGSNLQFWGFSMDELALIDLPLFIDTVLQKTGKSKLTYIGYSMGTTLSSMLLADKPEYNNKMNVVISIAPVIVFHPPLSTLATTLRAAAGPAKALALAGKVYQILPQSKLINVIGKNVCGSNLGKVFCETFLQNIVNMDLMNTTVIPTILEYIPAGASLYMVDQYVQFVNTEKFQRYDYGTANNTAKYGSSTPPEYDLTKVTSPQALMYSTKDVYSNTKDIEALNSTLPNIVALDAIDNYNHLDYMWLDDAKQTVYTKVLAIIAKYSS